MINPKHKSGLSILLLKPLLCLVLVLGCVLLRVLCGILFFILWS